MTTNNQFNLNDIMFAVVTVVILGVVIRIVAKELIGPRISQPLPVGPPEIELREKRLEAKRAVLEAQGRRIAEQTSARFVRLDEEWQPESATARYWFEDLEGNMIVATDLDELEWKLSAIGRYQ